MEMTWKNRNKWFLENDRNKHLVVCLPSSQIDLPLPSKFLVVGGQFDWTRHTL